jgi:hypothetical protein
MKTEREATGPPFEAANFERREHPRFAVNLALEYWRAGESGTRVGCTGNISEGGSLLHLPEEMEVGQEIGLRLLVDPGFGFLSIEARAQVIWKSRDNKQERDYRIGVKFVEISPKDMRNLKSFLASLAHLRIPSEIPRKLLSDLGISLVKTRKDSPECQCGRRAGKPCQTPGLAPRRRRKLVLPLDPLPDAGYQGFELPWSQI